MSKVLIGKIVNTCGLKGEVKVINSSDFINERYKKNNVLNIVNDSKNINENFTISSFRMKDKFIYLKFKEIDSIEKAETYKESLLLIDSEVLKKIDNDTFYHYELLDMEVYYKDELIGKISEISDNGPQDLIRVEKNKKSFLVPFLDEFIENIDIENKRIILKNIEGLL